MSASDPPAPQKQCAPSDEGRAAQAGSSETREARRRFLKLAGLGVGGTLLGTPSLTGGSRAGMASQDGRSSRSLISIENARAGDPRWGPQYNTGADFDAPVQAYATRESLAPGEEIAFCVSADQPYRIELYRVGWYGGQGGRNVKTLEGASPRAQPLPTPQGKLKLVRCTWDVTDTVMVGDDWVSGLYYARFIPSGAEEEATAAPFVVREKTPTSAAVVMLPMNTLCAYNAWGGACLYEMCNENSEAPPGDAVSFDRPYANPYACHIGYAIHLVRWMEQRGYDVSYIAGTDMHRQPGLIARYALAICAGHSEYWTVPQYKSFEKARSSGTNLAFMGGNIGMWSVQFRSDALRTFDCNKDDKSLMFRNKDMPEARLTGLMGSGAGLWKLPDLTVEAAALDHPWMEGTGFEAGDKVVGVVGHEWDFLAPPSPDDHTRFFHYEGGTSQWEGIDTNADVISYPAASGATVFHCSTLGYPFQLDPDPTWDHAWPYSRVREYKPAVTKPNPKLQRFQKNVFDDLLRT